MTTGGEVNSAQPPTKRVSRFVAGQLQATRMIHVPLIGGNARAVFIDLNIAAAAQTARKCRIL
jgi:hypothetical protein